MSQAPRPHVSSVLLCGAAAGALAGAATGAIDCLWSWARLGQFLPGVGHKLGLMGFLASAYGLLGALAGLAVALGGLVMVRATRLGDLLRFGLAQHRRARAHDPRDTLVGLSLVLAGVPCVAGALAAAYVHGHALLAARKHMGLIIASAMGLALGAAALGLVASFLVARPIELALRGLGRWPRLLRAASSPHAPLVAAAVLAGSAGVAAAVASWDTLALLGLRPVWVGLCGAALAAPGARAGARLAARASAMAPRARAATLVAAPVVLIGVFLVTGAPEGVRKAASQHSGLGGPVARSARMLVDMDRDGHSPILGGGDCDDLDASVHPGAVDVPDDGVDQNCVGGDATLARSTGALAFAPVPPQVPADFNVVLITIDTLRADHLSAYGYHRTTSPVIDRIAADGALFVNSWAHAPSTRYSIPALLTGRYPLSVRYDFSVQGWPGLSDENTTIAEILQGAGMRTGAILNYWYFDPHRRMNQGFDHYDNENKRLHTPLPGEGPAKTQGSSSREQTDKAIAFVAQSAGARFFLWVHYYDPHYRYEAHPEVERFGTRPVDLYDGEIRFTDMHIGRLIAELERRGLYQRTVIVITGDHGEGFGEHGIDLHGYHLYAAQTRVPIIIRVPGAPPARVTMPAAHVDILPTLANLAGAPPSTEMMGRSLVDVITGQGDKDANRYVFQQLSYEGNNEKRGAANQQCHVIYNVSPDTSWELYRIDVDPLGARDVIDTVGDAPGPCAGARAALETWYDSSELPPGAAEALLPGRPEVARPLHIELGSEVRLLGVDLPGQPVRPGHSFEVTYTFEARAPLPGGWKVFAHFEGPGGHRFLGDHQPPRPLAWWHSGQYIRYTQAVTVPPGSPPGAYELWLGLFRKAERRPIQAPEGVLVVEDRARVGTVQVRR